MIISYIPIIFVIIGLLLFGFGDGPKWGKAGTIGLWMFVAAFLVTMMTYAKVTAHIG